MTNTRYELQLCIHVVMWVIKDACRHAHYEHLLPLQLLHVLLCHWSTFSNGLAGAALKRPKICWWQKQNYEYGVWQVLQLVELCIHTVYNLDAAAALITNTWVFYCPCCTCYWSTSFMNSKLFLVMTGSESWWIFLDAQAGLLAWCYTTVSWLGSNVLLYKCYSPWQR